MEVGSRWSMLDVLAVGLSIELEVQKVIAQPRCRLPRNFILDNIDGVSNFSGFGRCTWQIESA
jgi:hypothetical protein